MQATRPAHSRYLSVRMEVDKKSKPGNFLALRNVWGHLIPFRYHQKQEVMGLIGFFKKSISKLMARGKVIREFQNPGVAGAQNITFKKVNEESGKIDYTCSDKNAEMAEIFELQYSFRSEQL